MSLASSRLSGALSLALSLVASATTLHAQASPKPVTKQVFPTDPMASVPKLATVIPSKPSELAEVVERFTADQSVLNRRYDASDSPAQRTRMRTFYTAWRDRLRVQRGCRGDQREGE